MCHHIPGCALYEPEGIIAMAIQVKVDVIYDEDLEGHRILDHEIEVADGDVEELDLIDLAEIAGSPSQLCFKDSEVMIASIIGHAGTEVALHMLSQNQIDEGQQMSLDIYEIWRKASEETTLLLAMLQATGEISRGEIQDGRKEEDHDQEE